MKLWKTKGLVSKKNKYLFPTMNLSYKWKNPTMILYWVFEI